VLLGGAAYLQRCHTCKSHHCLLQRHPPLPQPGGCAVTAGAAGWCAMCAKLVHRCFPAAPPTPRTSPSARCVCRRTPGCAAASAATWRISCRLAERAVAGPSAMRHMDSLAAAAAAQDDQSTSSTQSYGVYDKRAASRGACAKASIGLQTRARQQRALKCLATCKLHLTAKPHHHTIGAGHKMPLQRRTCSKAVQAQLTPILVEAPPTQRPHLELSWCC
jgi:hypothetical protein